MTTENNINAVNENAQGNGVTSSTYKKTLFTLIIYTPGEEGWHDRCGDYHHGKESSLEMEYFESKEDNSHEKEIGKRMGQLQFNNKDVELKLLFNGIEPYNEPEYFYDDNTEEAHKLQYDLDAIQIFADENFRDLQIEETRRKEEAKRIKEAEETQRRIREKHAQEARERAELQRLKAKYGN